MCSAGLWEPMKVPTGLMCKNTFIDVTAREDYVSPFGPAACPLPSEGWRWSSEPFPRTHLNASADELYEAHMGVEQTPDWFMASPLNSGMLPSWHCSSIAPAVSGPSPFDWLLAESSAQPTEQWLSKETPEAKWVSLPPPGLLDEAFEGRHRAGEPARLPLRVDCSQAFSGVAAELPAPRQTEAASAAISATRRTSRAQSPAGRAGSTARAPACHAEVPTRPPRESGAQLATPAIAVKGRRRRNTKEVEASGQSQEPNRWMPTSMVIDLGGLVKVSKASN